MHCFILNPWKRCVLQLCDKCFQPKKASVYKIIKFKWQWTYFSFSIGSILYNVDIGKQCWVKITTPKASNEFYCSLEKRFTKKKVLFFIVISQVVSFHGISSGVCTYFKSLNNHKWFKLNIFLSSPLKVWYSFRSDWMRSHTKNKQYVTLYTPFQEEVKTIIEYQNNSWNKSLSADTQ